MDTSIPEIYTDLHMLSLHASLPISSSSVPASPTTASPPTSAGAISRAASCASGKWTNRFGGNTLKRRDQEPEPTNPPERKPGDPPQPLRPPEEKGPRPAYSNQAFIQRPSARGLRIHSEYIEPHERFKCYKIDDPILF